MADNLRDGSPLGTIRLQSNGFSIFCELEERRPFSLCSNLNFCLVKIDHKNGRRSSSSQNIEKPFDYNLIVPKGLPSLKLSAIFIFNGPPYSPSVAFFRTFCKIRSGRGGIFVVIFVQVGVKCHISPLGPVMKTKEKLVFSK